MDSAVTAPGAYERAAGLAYEILHAGRFAKSRFKNDTEFADWVQEQARAALFHPVGAGAEPTETGVHEAERVGREPVAADVAPRWIAVSERLPYPDTGEVLVWLTGGRCAFDEWHTHSEDPTGMGGATLDMGLMWRDYEFEEVTHWLPLPKAPTVDDDISYVRGPLPERGWD